MDQIQYAGNTLLTGSDIAHAVLAYAQALAANGESATISIPVQHQDGSVVTAEILIGPASQLIAEPVETSGPEIEEPEVVTRLRNATARLQISHPIAEAGDQYVATEDPDLDHPSSGLEL